MQLIRSLLLLGALALPTFAQDSSECDPQNDSNNDSTCISSMATASASRNATTTQAITTESTDANGRVTSFVRTSTITGPALVITSNVVSETVVSTNPKSLYVLCP